MANIVANLQRAGLPESLKVATATNECLRRLKNVSRELPESEIETVLKSYMRELRFGEYPINWRVKVLKSACIGYSEIWKSECQGTGHLNRPGHVTKLKRRAMKLEGNSNWFKTPSCQNTRSSQVKNLKAKKLKGKII